MMLQQIRITALKRMGDTVIDGLAKLSVEVNGLIIPGRSIERVLARHTFNAMIAYDDDLFKVLLAGSATAVRFRRRELLDRVEKAALTAAETWLGCLHALAGAILTQ